MDGFAALCDKSLKARYPLTYLIMGKRKKTMRTCPYENSQGVYHGFPYGKISSVRDIFRIWSFGGEGWFARGEHFLTLPKWRANSPPWVAVTKTFWIMDVLCVPV